MVPAAGGALHPRLRRRGVGGGHDAADGVPAQGPCPLRPQRRPGASEMRRDDACCKARGRRGAAQEVSRQAPPTPTLEPSAVGRYSDDSMRRVVGEQGEAGGRREGGGGTPLLVVCSSMERLSPDLPPPSPPLLLRFPIPTHAPPRLLQFRQNLPPLPSGVSALLPGDVPPPERVVPAAAGVHSQRGRQLHGGVHHWPGRPPLQQHPATEEDSGGVRAACPPLPPPACLLFDCPPVPQRNKVLNTATACDGGGARRWCTLTWGSRSSKGSS